MITLNTNSVAAKAAIDLSKNTFNLQKSLQRLSSGSRIANPGDDAGGLAVSMRLKAQINRTQGTQNNVSNALSFTQVQDGALSTVGSIVDRMSELRSFADDVTKNTSDIANYNTEFQQLRNQLNNIVSEQFNGVSLFASSSDGTFGVTTPSTNQLTVYTTEAGATGATISLAKMALGSALSLAANTTLAAASSDTVSLQSFSVANITQAIQNVATLRAQNAAASNRLQFAADQLSINKTNLESARSRIFDVDVATESSALARNQVLVQSSTAMLAQANGLSGLALNLLG
jgi:flagellin